MTCNITQHGLCCVEQCMQEEGEGPTLGAAL